MNRETVEAPQENRSNFLFASVQKVCDFIGQKFFVERNDHPSGRDDGKIGDDPIGTGFSDYGNAFSAQAQCIQACGKARHTLRKLSVCQSVDAALFGIISVGDFVAVYFTGVGV